MSDYIFLDGHVASSKNGKTWTGKYLVNSKQTARYIKESKDSYEQNKDKFLKMLEGKTKPYLIAFHYVRKSRHKWDFINACQTVQDLMVKYGWLEDDNCDEMFPMPLKVNGTLYSYDKEKPGVYIKVL